METLSLMENHHIALLCCWVLNWRALRLCGRVAKYIKSFHDLKSFQTPKLGKARRVDSNVTETKICSSGTKENGWFKFVANFSLICAYTWIVLKKKILFSTWVQAQGVPRKFKCQWSLLIPLFSLLAHCQVKQGIEHKLQQEKGHEYPG